MPDLKLATGSFDNVSMSVALIGPDERRRRAMAEALSEQPGAMIHEYLAFPRDLDELPRVLGQKYDVVVVDADSDPEFAVQLAESLSAGGKSYVMAYSADPDVRLAIRFMRAGVREFFTLPLDKGEVAEALARASSRPAPPSAPTRSSGKVFTFLGTKGGCGVTTIAANFAISLAQESERGTLLIDLGLPLGDAAINLGIVPEFSIANALQNPTRLDSNFLNTLVARHSSGVGVLAAPSEFQGDQPNREFLEILLSVARQDFDYIVVDVGSRVDLMDSALFSSEAEVYLITQVGISELRNANRMITRFFQKRDWGLQIVLNRYKPATLLFDDKNIERALTRPTQWKIPDDWASARRTQSTATPLALYDSQISIAIRQMARIACGLPADREEKKSLFSFFR
ncbi:MAG TPA: AAA family ATPase [Terracidiphilus sp.]|nr:AAA family ATPase [Terracidiphilus sp.]